MKRQLYIWYAILLAWFNKDKIYIIDLGTNYKLFSLKKLKIYNKCHARKLKGYKRISMNEINRFKIFETKDYE
jgi:hypothetical protein